MAKLTKVGVLSLGKVMGFLYGLIGLIFGVISAFFVVVGQVVSQAEGGGVSIIVATILVVVLPAFYGAVGFLFGLLSAWLYNLVARFIGGLEIEIE